MFLCRFLQEFDERIFFTDGELLLYNKTYQKSSGVPYRQFRRIIPNYSIQIRKEGGCYGWPNHAADHCRCFSTYGSS